MAQDWNMRCMLIDKQGNFGSIAGLPPAAMRYTEARLSPFAATMLEDLKLDTVDFVPTYDERHTEPSVLPSKFPNLLVNGGSGIAVGMATSIPPHNLGEVCKGIIALLDNPQISIRELMEHIPGPDFPTAGYIYGLLHDMGPEDCLRFASALGASCVRAIGTTPGVFTSAECAAFLRTNELKMERI